MTTRLFSFKSSNILLIWGIFLGSILFSSVLAQCPTIANNTQSFCDVESILVGDLVALDTGGGIVWYQTSTSTTPLLNIEGLINGEDYYADDNSGSCGSRQRVDVIIYGPPIGQPFQGFCLDEENVATISDLIATGNSVRWYPTQTGGIALLESTVLIDNSIFYADQENPDTGCRTSRLSVLVNVGLTPVPTGDSIQEFCVTPTSTPIVENLVASGNNNWYISLFSAFPLPSSTPLINGQVYYASTIDPPCESSGRLAVLVLLTNSPDPGINSTLDLCENASSIDLFTVLGGSPDSGGTWFPSLNSGTGIFDPNIDPQGIYTYTVDAVNVCPEQSSSVTVTVSQLPIAGTNSSIDLCTDSTATDLFNILGGTPNIGGTWSPALDSGTGVFNPNVDSGGVYTYTVSGTPPCPNTSASVTISLSTATNAGEDASIEICDDIGTINLFTSLGGTPDLDGTWSPALNSGTGIFDPNIDNEGTYTYTLFSTSPCIDDSASVTISVNELPNTGTNATIQLCDNNGTIDLFNSLGGAPDTGGIWSPTLASGTGIFDPEIDTEGIYSYSISGSLTCSDVSSSVAVSVETAPEAGEDASIDICDDNGIIDLFDSLGGTPDIDGTWSPELESGSGIFNPSIDLEGTYTYTVFSIPPCSDASASVTISISELPNTGTDATIQLCNNEGSVDLFDSLGGTPDIGGTWSPGLTSGTGVFDPNSDTEGIYTYSISGASACTDVSSTVNISVEDSPEAGEDASIEICDNNGTIDLFASLGGTPDAGGTWSPTLSSGTNIFDPLIDLEGNYAYTISGTSPCADDSASISIIVNNTPNAGNDANITICDSDGTIDLFNSLGGTPDLGGTWSPALSSGTGVFDPNSDTQGTYTYTVFGTPPCTDNSASVTITIDELANTGSDSTVQLCNNEGSINLFDSLGGTPDTGGTWSPELASGTGIFDPNSDAEGIYSYSISSASACTEVSSSVNVSVETAPEAGENTSLGICDDTGTINLFDRLVGSPDTGGTWSPVLSNGGNIFDPTIDAEGTYTYTILGTSPCVDDSASITITIGETQNSGSDASIELCTNDNLIDLFYSLGGSPDTGGTWSPTLTSGTGLFDPTIDIEGTYTYTISGNPPCGDASSIVNVTLSIGPNAGTDNTITICSNSDSLDLFDNIEGTPDMGGTWSPALNSGTGIFNPSIDLEGTYTYTISGTSACPDSSSSVTIILTDSLDAGENATVIFCSNDSPNNLFDSLEGSPQLGGTWSPELNSGTGFFDPTIDTEGTYTYTLSGATAPCIDDSATATVSIMQESNAGENGSVEVCTNSEILFLFDFLQGTPQPGGTWSPALASGTSEFNPATDSADEYTYTIAGISPCNDASATVTILIIPAPNAGENGSVDICSNGEILFLFDFLQGTPQPGGTWSPALASGTDEFNPAIDPADQYTYTVAGIATCNDASATVTVSIIQEPNAGDDGFIEVCSNADTIFLFNVLQGTPQTGGTWSPELVSGTDEFNPAIDPADQYTYTVTGIAPCIDASASAQVSIITAVADAGENGSVEVCSNSSILFLFDFLQGTPQPGGTWSPELTSGNDEFNPAVDSADEYTYIVAGIAPCNDASATVTVSIIPEPNAGIDSIITICIDDAATDLFNYLGGTPDTNGTWSPMLNSGTGIFDPSIDLEATYTYTVTSTECDLMDISSVRVTIGDKPNVSGTVLASEPSICIGTDILVDLSGSNQLIDDTYTIDYAITGANNASNTIDINVSGGNASFIIPSGLIQNPGISFITITGFYFVGEFCSGDTDLIALVEINILEIQTPQISDEGSQFCSQENPTILDLTNNIIDSEPIIWYNLPEDGITYSESEPLEDGATYFGSLQGTNGCESAARLEVRVSVIECLYEFIIPDGFSPNGDSINDDFDIENLEILYPNFKLSVYNRYGNILYEGNIDSQQWDGTSKNSDKILPVGVYFYIIEFNDGERNPKQGRVYLSR
jgi:gliding motility-associated-like protein